MGRIVLRMLAVLAVMLALVSIGRLQAGSLAGGPAVPSSSQTEAASSALGSGLVTPGSNGVQVVHSIFSGQTPPLHSIPPVVRHPTGPPNADDNVWITTRGHTDGADTAVQGSSGPNGTTATASMPATANNFEGVDFDTTCNCAPPDTDGAAGATQYLQIVNTVYQVFDKSGTSLYGPSAINSLWSAAGDTGPCATNDDGDPVVLYDRIAAPNGVTAGHWLVTQFTTSAPYDECVAISKTSDATAGWQVYDFQLSSNSLVDYPKLGIWPDGYYFSANLFLNGSTYEGPEACAFDRNTMLANTLQTSNVPGATMQCFSPGSNHNPMLPSDLDGDIPGLAGDTAAPPASAPNYFAEFGSPITIWQFRVNWTTPANSTFTSPSGWSVTPASFSELCASGSGNCVSQPSTSNKLEGLGDRFLFRLAYRNFGSYASLVTTHGVAVSSSRRGTSGAQRWYEIRIPTGGNPTLAQQSTYAPDSNSRWMGSVAMDKLGDMALGYSVSGSSTYPSIRYTGRLVGDTLNSMTQGETTLLSGGGSETSPSRWGDYSAMTLDPTNDCTFWYTQQYYKNTSSWNWATRIGSFKYPGCS